MSYLATPSLFDRKELLDELYLTRGIKFQKTVTDKLDMERQSQPSSNPSLDLKLKSESLRSSTPLPSEEIQYQIPKLFALIIGINRYMANYRTLRGAVPDGNDFKDYLMKRLRVPESQIITLFDQDATKSAIIEGFERLRDNEDIDKGDPIFIFYAGHGSQKPPHPEWEPQGPNAKMEVILPYDCGPDGTDPEPIPDREIGALIDEIAAKKGNNITVVFDCCHSASGSRGDKDDPLTLVRTVELADVPFGMKTGRNIKDHRPRGARPCKGYLHRGLASHMFISACSSSQDAVEYDGHGRLSTALLKLLFNTSPNKLRYRDLLENIESIPFQTPQCEGQDQDRLLFNGKVFLPQKAYSIQFDNEISEFMLNAGEADGIAIGAEFTAYSNSDKSLKYPPEIFIVERLSPFKSFMSTAASTVLGRQFSAIQTKAGNVEPFYLHIPPNDPFRAHYHSVRKSGTANLQNVLLVNKPEKAHLKACTTPGGQVVFMHTDKRVTRHATNLFTDGVKPNSPMVGSIIESAAYYFHELNRTSIIQSDIEDHIKVEFYKLDTQKVRLPKRSILEGLRPIEPNLCHDNTIDFIVEEFDSTKTKKQTPYGFKIVNSTAENLYVNAFYFDNTNFSIVPYYTTQCPSDKHALEHPLKGEGELTVGYGSGGWPPFVYQIHKGRDLDVGFLKIYLSTQPVDLSGIKQGSAFSETRSGTPWSAPPGEFWDTIIIPIIQRRNPNSS